MRPGAKSQKIWAKLNVFSHLKLLWLLQPQIRLLKFQLPSIHSLSFGNSETWGGCRGRVDDNAKPLSSALEVSRHDAKHGHPWKRDDEGFYVRCWGHPHKSLRLPVLFSMELCMQHACTNRGLILICLESPGTFWETQHIPVNQKGYTPNTSIAPEKISSKNPLFWVHHTIWSRFPTSEPFTPIIALHPKGSETHVSCYCEGGLSHKSIPGALLSIWTALRERNLLKRSQGLLAIPLQQRIGFFAIV